MCKVFISNSSSIIMFNEEINMRTNICNNDTWISNIPPYFNFQRSIFSAETYCFLACHQRAKSTIFLKN